MVEIKCQENDAVKLPNNIRQVGTPGEKLKIYIEDYVMTYLNQVACQKPFGQKAAVLLGEAVRKGKTDIFFISAAIHIEHAEIYEAISARDASKAKAFTFSHIENQRKAIIRSINESNQKE